MGALGYGILCLLYAAHLCLELQESNVRLRLTVISSAGFGDQINKQNRFDHCLMDHCLMDHCLMDHCLMDHCLMDQYL